MPNSIFARAKPHKVNITETYTYHADIHGNPTMEEKGAPQGEIVIEVPFDGEKYFTRLAYADIYKQYQPTSGDLSAVFGYLYASKISPEAFFPGLAEESNNRGMLRLELPIPGDKSQFDRLIDDCSYASLKHIYCPKYPDVYPRPRPIKLDIDIFDEFSIGQYVGEETWLKDWNIITEDRSFRRNLSFWFDIEVALPPVAKSRKPPVVRLIRLDWPAETSYHMLELQKYSWSAGSNGQEANELEENLEFFYNPEHRSLEWKDIPFEPVKPTPGSEPVRNLILYQTPSMILKALQPGELYNKNDSLTCRLEVEIPGTLLSGMEVQFFQANGEEFNPDAFEVKTRSVIIVDIEINLKQRFKRKILSPLYQLQFEGVKLEAERMHDLKNLLINNGFNEIKYDSVKDGPDHTRYGLHAAKEEGPDTMHLWVRADGSMGKTERLINVPGVGYRTEIWYGNTELSLRAELSGNVRKLSQIMNKIHTSLKKLFVHTVESH